MLRKTSIAILLMSVATAYAHPRLETSNPAQGAILKVAPKEIRMSFSEILIANFTGLELKDVKGRTIRTGKAARCARTWRS